MLRSELHGPFLSAALSVARSGTSVAGNALLYALGLSRISAWQLGDGMLYLFRLTAFGCVLCSFGCAQSQMSWEKPGSGPDEFNKARYACLQQTQQPYSTAYIGRYGGSASGGMTTNAALFNACMQADGWALIANPVMASPEYAAAVKAISEEAQARCRRPEYQSFYSRIPCNVKRATSEQLADRGKFLPGEKQALDRLRAGIKESNAKLLAVHRQYNAKFADAIAATFENGDVAYDRNAQEFIEGRITRGEYNRRRRDIALQADAEVIRIMSVR